ncbi:glycosyltransferase family 87 protein [Enhydrobacter sp.]|jgi:hypothetical protein|uniref:glycosyltransferase family 87 protein n=1 Tax=Enhydrobacter sp. TaxID=1894999 RepID=UPI002619912C|nr:glycosyltransferase family 87 protein [Enhydrobacter sp.]WIM10916.1 MAG: hypothetical protein OJF58_001873 [Enhydrobacter sp.]
MSAPSKTDLRLAAFVCGSISLYDVAVVVTTITGIALVSYRVDVLFPDFLVFHAAARAAIEGKLSVIYDTAALTDFQNKLYAARLPFELGFRPFLYPPPWLLGILPFGLLPIGIAVAAFLVLTATFCTIALRSMKLTWAAVLVIVTSPAAVWVVLAGQNTFLSIALLYGGLALLERKPIAAGVLLGLLAYKPQVWLLVPVALLAARAWRPLVTVATTVILLLVTSLLAFGSNTWFDFIAAARHASSGTAAAEMYARVHVHMTTLLAAAKTLGLSDQSAMTLQLLGSAVAVGVVAWVFYRHPASHARTALLVTATFLVSPYTLNYDLLLLMPATALLFLGASSKGCLPGERVVYLSVWLIPTVGLLLNYMGLPLTPLVILLFGAVAWARLRDAAKVELPQPATAR